MCIVTLNAAGFKAKAVLSFTVSREIGAKVEEEVASKVLTNYFGISLRVLDLLECS